MLLGSVMGEVKSAGGIGMKHFKYLIIGGGLTGDSAVRGIRELDADGSIGMFSIESDPPYKRPELSKRLWKGKAVEKIWRKTEDRGVAMFLHDRISRVDAEQKTATDEHGTKYRYDKLLFATGCHPVTLPFGEDDIIYFRNLDDYRKLRALTEVGDTFFVIGGGFIGSEIASALAINDKKVIMAFPEEAIGSSIFPSDLSLNLNDYYRSHDVEVLNGDSVDAIEKKGNRLLVRTKKGQAYEVDGVIAGVGVRPTVDLAEETGLSTDNGIVVDEHLRTSHPDIYAAGDVANFFHSQLKKRVRIEHEDNALTSGKLAGRNMAGAEETYTHVPAFYSDLFDLGYEVVGELSGQLETISDWQEPFRKGVVYYLAEDEVRGILLWNIWDGVPAARRILARANDIDRAELNIDLLISEMAKDEKTTD